MCVTYGFDATQQTVIKACINLSSNDERNMDDIRRAQSLHDFSTAVVNTEFIISNGASHIT